MLFIGVVCSIWILSNFFLKYFIFQNSGSRMRIAGRFKPCVHMGCFDLETFVELNQRSRKVRIYACSSTALVQGRPNFCLRELVRNAPRCYWFVLFSSRRYWIMKKNVLLIILWVWSGHAWDACRASQTTLFMNSYSIHEWEREGFVCSYVSVVLGMRDHPYCIIAFLFSASFDY